MYPMYLRWILQTLWSQPYILTICLRSTLKENIWPNYTTNTMTFHSVCSTLLFICGNIPSAPVYGVFTSQLIRYDRSYPKYANFLYRARLCIIEILEQGNVATRLKSSLQKFYGCQNELVGHYGVFLCTKKTDLFIVA